MTRIKNTTFRGATPRSVVADAPIRRDWLANVAGDIALITDRCTGQHGESPITHTGGTNGCPLRLPIAAQHLDRSIIVYGTGPVPGEDVFIVIAVPIFVPDGEHGIYRLDVDMRTPAGVVATLSIMDGTGAIVWGPTPGEAIDTVDDMPGARRVSRAQRWRWDFELPASGVYYVLVRRPCFFSDKDPDGRLVSWTLDHVRPTIGDANGISAGHGGTAVTDQYLANASTFSPSTIHDTYDEEVVTTGPLSSYVLTRLNRHINALWERITGAVIPGNATYQTTTTWDNNRSSFANEGLLDFPVTVVSLGACHGDTGKKSVSDYATTTPSDGLIGHTMHPTSRSTTHSTIASLAIQCPSFRSSPSDLTAIVLCHAPGGAGTASNWRFRATSSAGTTSDASLVQVGSTNFLIATIASIPFAPSTENYISIQIANTSIGTLGKQELDILGVCMFFDP